MISWKQQLDLLHQRNQTPGDDWNNGKYVVTKEQKRNQAPKEHLAVGLFFEEKARCLETTSERKILGGETGPSSTLPAAGPWVSDTTSPGLSVLNTKTETSTSCLQGCHNCQ